MDMPLAQLTQALPEIYQPIFGHPELSIHASRACDDRVEEILVAMRALSLQLGRQPRVLDLGCAQGYISMRLAQAGALVTGVDIQVENINVCRALADEYPAYWARFILSDIETFISGLDPDSYDLVLGLSVFHHLIHFHGFVHVQPLLQRIAQCSGAAIFEFASSAEPMAWARSQPEDTRDLLGDFLFVHELGRFGTHLSTQTRRMFFGSCRYWYLDGAVEPFSMWANRAQRFASPAYGDTRHYFMNDRLIAKVYELRGFCEHENLNEITGEGAFLTKHGRTSPQWPRLHTLGSNVAEAWLVRERLDGDLLLEAIIEKKPFDVDGVVHDILTQCLELEQRGLYHSDLRTWNVLLREDGHAAMIDYGSIDSSGRDCTWPHNVFFAFWMFVVCVTTRSSELNIPCLSPRFHPRNLPLRYQSWANAFWQSPPEAWSFASLREAWYAHLGKDVPSDSQPWLDSLETHLADFHRRYIESGA